MTKKEKNMREAVVIGGTGMVGNATMKSLGIEYHYSRRTNNIEGLDADMFKYIFICLPTPTIDGKQFIYTLEDYIKRIAEYKHKPLVIIRSTVLPGTCKRLEDTYGVRIVHVPEFLTESTWEQDSKWPDLIVIGANNNEIREEVAGIFKARFKGAHYILTDTVTSETIKYAINTLYAVKVVFGNQIFDFSTEVGANYETIKEALYARKWIGKNHLDVWHNGKRGAGGKCLEKDLDAFATLLNSPLLKVANELNKKYLHENPKAVETIR